MRRVAHALLMLALISCGDDATLDVDARAEDPDVTDVGPRDARDASGPPAPWRHEPIITIQSTEPCEDWAAVEPMPRGLPGDATPRLLWRYRPSEDPLYSGAAASNYSGVSEPVVSPDGTIWVRGPRAAHVTQLSRDGHMRRWFRAGGANEDDPQILSRLGPLLPLPDGRVVGAIYTEDGPRGGLSIMNPNRRFLPAENAEAGAILSGLNYYTILAVGPQGMVYATAGNKLYATCQGERLMWTLTNEGIDPGIGDGRFFYLRVDADGRVVVSGGAQRSYRINPQLLSIDAFEPPGVEDGEANVLLAQTPSLSVFNTYDRSLETILLVTSDGHYRLGGEAGAQLSPVGPVHFWNGQLVALDPPYSGEPRPIPMHAQFTLGRSRWFDTGEWVNLNNGVTRYSEQGEEVWNVPVAAEGEDAGLGGEIRVSVMDQTGVVFAALQVGLAAIELAAIQTDGLPPPMSVCVENGCNAHRDRWVRPAE
ncbi:MAG: hypothetical protein AB8H86_32645 [Polyangiales bacterium]